MARKNEDTTIFLYFFLRAVVSSRSSWFEVGYVSSRLFSLRLGVFVRDVFLPPSKAITLGLLAPACRAIARSDGA